MKLFVRMQVLGCKLMNSMCRLSTKCLAKHIMDYLKGVGASKQSRGGSRIECRGF